MSGGPVLSSGRVSLVFFFSSRRRHTRCGRDWSSDVCSSDLIPHELVHRRLKDTGQRGDFPPDALPVTHEQGPDELRGDEVRLLYQATQCRSAAQPAQAADRELAHRPSNLDAPWARSKSATCAPAAPGSRSSISAEAVICTEPSCAVTRPYNLLPSPRSPLPQ